jgi:hypothetical protein
MSFILPLKKKIANSLSDEQRNEVKNFLKFRFRGIQHYFYQLFVGSNLKVLADIYGTDKWNGHYYAQHYETHFAAIRHQKLNILEIGIGGYEDPRGGGESLRMWRTYFPNANIFGIDIYEKSCHDERRIKTFKGSQVDDNFLQNVIEEIGQIDIVVDDGSHINEHVIHTFNFLFPRINCQWYVVEDVQTSYWENFGGTSEDFNNSRTIMSFFKQLTDGLNHIEYRIPGYKPTYFDRHIIAMSFYHNMIFVQKGTNNL